MQTSIIARRKSLRLQPIPGHLYVQLNEVYNSIVCGKSKKQAYKNMWFKHAVIAVRFAYCHWEGVGILLHPAHTAISFPNMGILANVFIHNNNDLPILAMESHVPCTCHLVTK